MLTLGQLIGFQSLILSRFSHCQLPRGANGQPRNLGLFEWTALGGVYSRFVGALPKNLSV